MYDAYEKFIVNFTTTTITSTFGRKIQYLNNNKILKENKISIWWKKRKKKVFKERKITARRIGK